MRTVKIKEIGEIITGKTPPTKEEENYLSNDYHFICPPDIKRVRYILDTNKMISSSAFIKSKSIHLHKRDIVMDCIGADLGNVAIVTKDCISNQQINSITNIDEKTVLPLYLYYLLSTKKKFFHLIGQNGSTMPIINKTMFENIELIIHDKPNQQHIVNTIGTIDDLIEIIDLQNIKIQQIISIKFSYLKESSKVLTDICDIKYGKSIEASKLTNNSNYPVYGGNGIIGTLSTYEFVEPKIAISCRGSASGNVILTKPYSTISSNSLYLNLKNKNALVPLYSFLLNCNLNNYTTGSAQPQITIDNIKNLHVPDFDNCNDGGLINLVNLLNSNENKKEKLNEIKQTLLSKYFTSQ